MCPFVHLIVYSSFNAHMNIKPHYYYYYYYYYYYHFYYNIIISLRGFFHVDNFGAKTNQLLRNYSQTTLRAFVRRLPLT